MREEVEPRTAAMGFLFALKRFDQAIARAYGPYRDLDLFRDGRLIGLIESLTWLWMLFDHPDTKDLIIPDAREALRFARGRSLHAWADAIEFRTDVPLELSLPPGTPPVEGVLISDWCWRPAAELPGGKRQGHTSGKAEYERAFAGRPTRRVLGEFVDIAARITSGL